MINLKFGMPSFLLVLFQSANHGCTHKARRSFFIRVTDVVTGLCCIAITPDKSEFCAKNIAKCYKIGGTV